MRYDPIPDSNDRGRKRLVMERDPATGPLIVIDPGECWCGCHEVPKRGRRFKPGHDTRFRGILQRAHRGDVPVTIIVGAMRLEHPADWWWEGLKLRKESEAVRRLGARHTASAVAGIERILAGFDPLDLDADVITASALADAKRLASREERRLKLG